MNTDRLEPSTTTMHKNVQRNRYMNLLENRRIEIETHNEFEQRLARQRDRDALINKPHSAKSNASKVDVTKKEGRTNAQSNAVHINGANRKRSSGATSSMNGHTAKRAKHDALERLSSSVALDIEHSSSDSDNDGDADSDGDVGSASRINTRGASSTATTATATAAAGSADFMSSEEVTALVKQVYLARQSAAAAAAAGTSGTGRSNTRRASSSSSINNSTAGVLPDISPLVDTFFQLLEHIVTEPVDSATRSNNNNRNSRDTTKQSSVESQRQKYASALRAAIDRIAPQPKAVSSSSSASITREQKGQTKRSAPKDGSSKRQRNVSKASTRTVSKPAASADNLLDSSNSSEDESEHNSDEDDDSDGDGDDSVAIDLRDNHTRKEETVNCAKDGNNAVALALAPSSSSSSLWSSSTKGKKTALTTKKSLRRTEEDEDEDEDVDEGNGDHTHSASAKVNNRMDVVADAVPVVVDLTSPESAATTSHVVKSESVYSTAARDRDTSSVASSRAESITTATTSVRAPTAKGPESAAEPKKLTTKERIAQERAKAAAKKLQQQQHDGNTAPGSAAAVADNVSDAGTVTSRATATSRSAHRAEQRLVAASEAVNGLSLHASPFDTAFTSSPPPPASAASAPASKSVILSGSGEAVGDLVVSNSFAPTATVTARGAAAAAVTAGEAQQREAPVIVAKKSQPTAASAKLPRAAEIRGQFTLNRSSSDSLLPNGTSPAAQTLSNNFKAGAGSGVTANERDRHLEPPPPAVLRAHSAGDASWPRQQPVPPSISMPAPHTTHNLHLATTNSSGSSGTTSSTHVMGSIAYSNKPPASNRIQVIESEAERRAREKKRMETERARVMLQDGYKDPKQEARDRRKLMKEIGRYIPKIVLPNTTTAVVSTGGVTPRSSASSANTNNNSSRPLYNTTSAVISINNPGRRLSGETSSSTTTLSHHSSSAGSSSIQIAVAPKPSRPVGSSAVGGSSGGAGAGVERRSM